MFNLLNKCIMEKNYNVEILYVNETTGLFRTAGSYRFTSSAATVNSLKDVVRRDVKQMGYSPDAILIKDVNTGNSYVINCRKA